MLKKIKQFFREVVSEVKKVSWPGRNEVFGSTVVVIVLVLFIALYIGQVDFVLSRLLNIVLQ